MENKEAMSVWYNMMTAAKLMRYGVNRWDSDVGYIPVVPKRYWHGNLQGRFDLHPAVQKMCQTYRPHDWQQLVLEWPHKSETDSQRIAYTRDERAGETDRQVVTTLGKYLTRHFPHVADHEVRNMVASFSSKDVRLVRTTAEMIQALMAGPKSCMTNHINDNLDDHPYKCYDPRLGWAMAVRYEGGEIVGRALVYERGNAKTFVRSYLRAPNGGYSNADDQLQAWLRDQGYSHEGDWETCDLMYYPSKRGDDAPMAPYLDGSVKRATVTTNADGIKVLRVDDDGEWDCEQTDGRARSTEGGDTCEDCGDSIDDGDGYWVGMNEDSIVCQSCCDNEYYYGYGRNGRQYYINCNDAVHVGDEVYHDEYLGDNDIVTLHDGEYCHRDDATYIESVDEYYEDGDDAICYDEFNSQYELVENCVELHDGTYCHSDDAWQCEHSDDWYSDADVSEKFETPCGKTVHSDYADEYPDADEEDEDEGATVAEPEPVTYQLPPADERFALVA